MDTKKKKKKTAAEMYDRPGSDGDFGAAVRALFVAQPQPQRDELAELRTAIDRTARVVQAMNSSYLAMDFAGKPSDEYGLEASRQEARLIALLQRERELTEKGGE
jgi:hypothetical protein